MALARETTETLQRIADADLFNAVKTPLDDATVVQLATWNEGMLSLIARDWEKIRLRWRNELTMILASQFPREDSFWNEYVAKIKGILLPAITPKISAVTARHKLPKRFEDVVSWDLLNACMEVQYGKFVKSERYVHLLQWYLKGRIPCGWRGEFPSGKLAVL